MIDLAAVRRLLDDCDKAVSLLDGRDVEDKPDLQRHRDDATAAGRRRAEVAECSRELLRLSDNLVLAGALVRNEYHVLKGAPDLLSEES